MRRLREELPGLGSCDGAASEERACDNDACPLENDDESLVVVIGGETVASRECIALPVPRREGNLEFLALC